VFRQGDDPQAGTGTRRRLTAALVEQEDAGVISSRESP
jgi:hypothetical protein